MSMTVTPRAMTLVIGFAALGLVGVAWTPQLEASSPYSAVSTDDSVVSLLQVSGKKKVGDNRTTDAGASVAVSRANGIDRGLQKNVTSKVNDGHAVGRHPATVLLESMAELHRMVKAKVEGLLPQVPTSEGMLFTACLVAGIMVMAVTLAMLYHGASTRRPLPSALGRTNRADAASIPGMDDPSASAGDVSAMSTAEVGGAGMRKPKPGCC
ncbi:unnamed protein product [Cladocopium goreaui]|uniref:Transmembrane protein n=1 Tax=Cladocopium goreaui TaxID=2562237 RepID=A0A9P1GNE2_9DINO|nr:unnamed protein product [Cladocopium goreaui]